MKLNEIEDFYVRLGYRGRNLRKALENDKKYRMLLARKKLKITRQVKATKNEKKRYVLSVDGDIEILEKCKKLI